jgi:hypothetical protein
VKAAVATEVNKITTATFAAKFDEKSLKPLGEAIAKGATKKELAKALFKPFEASLKTPAKWGHWAVEPEAGLEFSATPLVIRGTGCYENDLIFDGAPYKGKFAVKFGVNVGLSKKGKAWLLNNVGRPLLERVLGPLAEWLASDAVITAGVVAGGTVVGTLAFSCLCAWVFEHEKHKDDLKDLKLWYVQGYVNKTLLQNRPTVSGIGDLAYAQEAAKLVRLGEEEAVLNARAALLKVNHPAVRGPAERPVLEAYYNMLMAESSGNYDTAKRKLESAVRTQMARIWPDT